MPQSNQIVIAGAREHNLKDISLELSRDALVVITGLSGSGKSSLAFDTIYAEGQRRYVESLSAYARQFLERMEKPDVDKIEGISPAIAIRQKNSIRNPRSTVGTTTEIHDYMRLLFAQELQQGVTRDLVCDLREFQHLGHHLAEHRLHPVTKVCVGQDAVHVHGEEAHGRPAGARNSFFLHRGITIPPRPRCGR